MNKNEMIREIKRDVNVGTNRIEICQLFLDYFTELMTVEEYYFCKLSMSEDVTSLESLVRDVRIPSNVLSIANRKLIEIYENKQEDSCIPKIIHLVYINPSKVTYKCIDSIVRNHPEYEIWIHNGDLDVNSYPNVFIKGFERKINQSDVDILKLEILRDYGGIYIDLNMYMFKNISPLLETGRFFIPGKDEQNYIIACEKESGMIIEWLHLLRGAAKTDTWNAKEILKLLIDRRSYNIKKYGIELLDHNLFYESNQLDKIDVKCYGIYLSTDIC